MAWGRESLPGCQAIVGNIKHEGEGVSKKFELNTKQLPIHQALWSADAEREVLLVSRPD
jgi:hypothetical protein